MNYPTWRSVVSGFALSVLSVVILSAAPVSQVSAQEQKASEKQTRKTPALRARVYDQLSRAQTAGDAGNTQEAIAILKEVEDKSSSMNSYELAMLYNFYGFIYYNAEDYDEAIESFEKVVQQQPIPETFEQTTLFSLAQLHLMRGNYAKSIEALERWESLQTGPIPPKNLVIKAQAYYQNKQYKEAEKFITAAIEGHEADGMLPDEGWLILQRAVFYELKQPEKVKDVLIKLLKLYEDPKYWIQLAGMYGELEREEEQYAIMEAAYQQGYVKSASDTFNLAQLYYFHQAPYKCARLMEQALADGTLERNLRNLKFLSQCWTQAKENEKAVPVMQAAADLSDDGDLDAQLGQIYLNLEQWDKAIAATQKALEKGDLSNKGTAHLVLGMAYYNKRQFVDALNELAEAEKDSSSRGMAQQWRKYVQGEKQSYDAIQAELSS
ncbi:tetratricopeptide repeat protein [Alteromonas oceanisediminis]|uniref:tetratricopeptide repeat protein n=1 Tax=Alteromonas oceanisediminis TaxID=2836180 RepID=UPI001BDA7081|nr:tetratricopeptide repeat protein [Alteromonas oceanisediminis]MBT0585282.1 tetratricopeptide repeat protein [Alteromonas oceanisediminis]